jgi:hypothetical protein
MTSMHMLIQWFVLLGALVLGGVAAAEPGPRTVTFAVGCYDVGKQALDGLPGVRAVSSGWRDGVEVNVVRYDPDRIDPAGLADALRRAGTYRATLPPVR